MARKKDMTDDQKTANFLKVGWALKEALNALEVANQRLSRLYPQQHEYRETVERLHADTHILYQAMDQEYAYELHEPEGTLQKIVRHEVPQPVTVREEIAS